MTSNIGGWDVINVLVTLHYNCDVGNSKTFNKKCGYYDDFHVPLFLKRATKEVGRAVLKVRRHLIQ